MNTKDCRICRETKPSTEFYKGRTCKTCHKAKNKEWQKKNPDKLARYKKTWGENKGRDYFKNLYRANPGRFKAATKKFNQAAKDKCYAAYGGYVCACCGEKEPKFLTLDHINNDGAEHRRSLSSGPRKMGSSLYQWAIKNNFPPIFQILCYNCNCGKNVNGGICPHKGQN